MDRYSVSEVRGYLYPENHAVRGKGAGSSFTVHDRAYGCRAVAVYRSEDYSQVGGVNPRERAEEMANARCLILNARDEAGPT